MYSIIRRYLVLGLVLLLVLTSQSMAVARGMTGPVGQMVLCTGTGPVSVFVDQNGQPVAPPHYCPDCALDSMQAVALDAKASKHVARLVTLEPPVVATVARTSEILAPSARGPPVSV